MKDEDFNRLMSDHNQFVKRHFAIVFLICVVAVLLLTWSVASAQTCCSTGTAWRIEIDGEPVKGLEGLTEEECEPAAQEIDAQTPPFSRITCVEYEVSEQQS